MSHVYGIFKFVYNLVPLVVLRSITGILFSTFMDRLARLIVKSIR